MTTRFKRAMSVCAALAVTLAACSKHDQTSPAETEGQSAMTQATPPLPPGFVVKEAVPRSQQQAQDTVLGYLTRTLAALPAGAVVDASRYGMAGHNSYCDDNDSSPTAPRYFHTIGEVTVPGDAGSNGLVDKVGEIWRGWGWYVTERDGFAKPNRFGYGPDGYRIQIEAAPQAGYPPSIEASSPCFPGQIARDDIPTPIELRAD